MFTLTNRYGVEFVVFEDCQGFNCWREFEGYGFCFVCAAKTIEEVEREINR